MAGLPSFWAQFRGAHPPWLSANPILVTYGDRGLLALKSHSECGFIPCHIRSQEEGLAGLSWKWRNPSFLPMLFLLRDL